MNLKMMTSATMAKLTKEKIQFHRPGYSPALLFAPLAKSLNPC
jgi:hypothetical protein